jgi:hypothetical protein
MAAKEAAAFRRVGFIAVSSEYRIHKNKTSYKVSGGVADAQVMI